MTSCRPNPVVGPRSSACFAERAQRYGYGLAITPMFEHVEVFHRVGEHTDVVAKEMYELTDKGGRRLALRPEGTASVVRAYVQHRPTPPWKVWYVAPNFRYERAQKGRYRQHWQLGVEALGVTDADDRRRGHRPARGLLPGPRARRTCGCCSTRWATPRLDPATSPRSRDHFLAPRRRARRRVPIAGRGEPVAGARREGRGVAGRHRVGAAAHRAPVGCVRRSLRVGAGRASGARHRVRARPPARPGLRLLHGHDVRVPERRPRRGAERGSAAVAATTGSPRRWAVRRRRGSGSAPGSSASCSRWTRAGIAPSGAGIDVFVVDGLGDPATSPSARWSRVFAAPGFAVDRAYGGRSVKAQWKLADRSGAAVRVMVGPGRGRTRRGRGQGPRDRRAGRSPPNGSGGMAPGPPGSDERGRDRSEAAARMMDRCGRRAGPERPGPQGRERETSR